MSTLSISGTTNFDRAYAIWHSEMNHVQRGEVLGKPEVARYKSTPARYRAALKWIENNMVSGVEK